MLKESQILCNLTFTVIWKPDWVLRDKNGLVLKACATVICVTYFGHARIGWLILLQIHHRLFVDERQAIISVLLLQLSVELDLLLREIKESLVLIVIHLAVILHD